MALVIDCVLVCDNCATAVDGKLRIKGAARHGSSFGLPTPLGEIIAPPKPGTWRRAGCFADQLACSDACEVALVNKEKK